MSVFPAPRNRNWCFTSFGKAPQFDDETAAEVGVTYMVYQKEKCPKTDREHYQGYIELNTPRTMRSVKYLLDDKTIHLEPRRGTQAQAIKYCKKLDTQLESPVEWGEPKQQGKRSDIDAIYQDIQEGSTLREVLDNHGGNALRIIHAVERAAMIFHGFCAIDEHIKLHRRIEQACEDGDTELLLTLAGPLTEVEARLKNRS